MDPKPSPLDNWTLNPPLLITGSHTLPKRGRFKIQLSRWDGLKSSYQEGRDWDPVIKRGGFGIQLSRGEGLRSSYQEGKV
jgi:hypothetical protein